MTMITFVHHFFTFQKQQKVSPHLFKGRVPLIIKDKQAFRCGLVMDFHDLAILYFTCNDQ